MLDMAQYTPKSDGYFDVHWPPRISLGAKVVRDAQDCWLGSDDPFPTELLTAILLWIFRFDFQALGHYRYTGISRTELLLSTRDDWRSRVRSKDIECQLLLPGATSDQREDVLDEFSAILGDAIGCWETNIHAPAADRVVLEFAELLAERRLIKLR